MTWCRLLSAFFLLIAGAPGSALAQDRAVVFVHGLGSSGDTWQPAADALQQQLAIEAHRPTQNWREQYDTQASQLHSAVGSLPGSTVAVGHSNGGIVSREWSKLRPLGGIVTIGTPHSGAPLAGNVLKWFDFNYALANRIDSVYSGFSQCIARGCDWEWVIFHNGLHEFLQLVLEAAEDSMVGLVSTVGFQAGLPVFPQMSPQSSFIAALNSSGNLAREASDAGPRVGIVSVARNWFDAGWYRVKWPDSADTVDNWKDTAAALMDYGAEYLWGYGTQHYSDLALDVAAWMSAAAGRLFAIDSVWCHVVTTTSDAYACQENDTIVPVWSQTYPNAARIDIANGPVHIRETTEGQTWIYQALTNHMSIPARGGGGGGGDSGSCSTSGAMQGNSAIRGCDNWTWWNPVYQPSQDACHSYCASNGAQACEYDNRNGECYVEFGSGCRVESGFPGWCSAVLSGGGGGGTGGMQEHSAIRGCENWTWWDPVYTPDAGSCASYCAHNGANACEWYANGECYVEFGSGCYVEAGYQGWSAKVL